MIRLNPYLNFHGNARDAMEFYRSVLGGELAVNTFAEFQVSDDPALQDNVMHAMLEAPGGPVLMASDVPPGMEATQNGAVSLSGDDEARLRACWDGLSLGATIVMPLEQAPWGDTFGMCVDTFGISWMVNITSEVES